MSKERVISTKVINLTVPVFWYEGPDGGYVLDTEAMGWAFNEEVRKLEDMQAQGITFELLSKNQTDGHGFDPKKFQQWWSSQSSNIPQGIQ